MQFLVERRIESWQLEPKAILEVKRFFDGHQNDPFVQRRIQRNTGEARPVLTKDTFWHRLIACLLTTQQKSGPTSPVGRFLRRDPFPLSFETCCEQSKLPEFASKVLSTFGGIRRYRLIADSVNANLGYLEKGGWSEVFEVTHGLRTATDWRTERRAARFLDDSFKGIGPKQSRSLLQQLGLTKYEVPIDSRMVNWLNELGFPIDRKRLGNRAYYESAVDEFRRLSEASGLIPCVLDAAIFASVDQGDWNEHNVF